MLQLIYHVIFNITMTVQKNTYESLHQVPRQRFFTGSNTVTPPTRSRNDFSGTNIVTHCPCMNQRHPWPRLRSFQRIVFDKIMKLLKCPFAPSQHSVELPPNQSLLRLLSTRLYWLLTFAQAPSVTVPKTAADMA